MILYTYFRSSCSYRVRIALNIKQIATEYRFINIHPDVSEQREQAFLSVNPQGRVPYFVDGEVHLSQSPAILEYLEEHYKTAALLPDKTVDRARVRQLANIIACDVQPLNNLSVLATLKNTLMVDQPGVDGWYAHWIRQGFTAFEALLADTAGEYCVGNTLSLADVYLVPQVWNARRFNVPIDEFPIITRIAEHCNTRPEFIAAAPEQQKDFPASS